MARRIVERKRRGDDIVVVVSAMANTTDELIQLAFSIDKNPPERELDMLLTAGERISMALMSIAIQKLGFDSVSFTGSQSGIITDDDHTRARIIDVRPTRIVETLNSGAIAIVAGFQGVSGKKDVTTLGRGGSDTTAVALGIALGAGICEIYTDVEGVFSADPDSVKTAQPIERLTFEETLDMAYFGAGVIHSRAVELARVSGLPMLIATSLEEKEGTRIMKKIAGMERPRFVGISRREDICMCGSRLKDISSVRELFKKLEKSRIRVGFPRTSKTADGWDISFWAESNDIACLEAMKKNLDLEINENVCLLGLVGEEIAQRAGVVADILDFLSEKGVEPIMIGATQVSIVIIVERACGERLEGALHDRFVMGEAF